MLWFLASTTGLNISILITYIVFVTKMQKGQTSQKNLPFLKTISQVLNPLLKLRIHSSKHNFSGDFLGGVTKPGYVFRSFRFEIKNPCQNDWQGLCSLTICYNSLTQWKTLFLSDNFKPNAKRIFRFVSILHGLPCSIRVRVSTDRFAILASSALLIKKDSLISFKEFVFIFLRLK